MPAGRLTGIYETTNLWHNLPSLIYAAAGGGNVDVHLSSALEFGCTEEWNLWVECDVGGMSVSAAGKPKWTYTPSADDAGDHTWTVHARHGNREVWSVARTLRVSAGTATTTRKLALCGDSTLDERGAECKRLLDASGMTVSFVGTNSTTEADSTSTNQNYDHEGYSGRKLANFMNQAPFAPGGSVDCATWVSTHSFGSGDIFYLALGINDMYGQTTDTAATTVVTSWHSDLDTLIGLGASPAATTLRGAASGCRVLLDLVIPPSRDEAWIATGYDPWQYRRNVWRLRKALIDTYDNATYRGRNIYVMGGHLGVDSARDYPETSAAISDVDATTIMRGSNAVHPADTGSWKLGAAIATAVLNLG